MKVLIVGGGIAGTTLAAFLQKNKKFKITLIDQAPKFGNIGFAIALWGNGRHVLKELGLERSLVEKLGYEIPWDVAEDSSGRILKSFYFSIFKDFGPTVIISRTDLHGALIGLLKNVEIRFGITITKVKNSPKKVSVEFSNGTKEQFDLVVGADGVHSKTRSIAFKGDFTRYSGWRVWSFWLPSQFGHPAGALDILGDGKIYLMYPLYDRAVVLFGVTTTAKSQITTVSTIDNLRDSFKGFSESVQGMINSITDPNIFNADINYVEMEAWYKNRIVLIGDAQHAISPVTGMGASLAMEDAFVLAEELNKVKNNSVSTALRKFRQRRDPRMKKIKKASRRVDTWLLSSGIFASIRNTVLPFVPKAYFLNTIKDLLKEKF